ncbi:MAG: flagellin [Gemmatimonadaceae bacterium]|nr:flagellin [Gemmatimonadaceae bacterium]
MRITNALTTRNAVRSMLISQQGMDRATRQITSGYRIDKPSDAPTDTSAVMGASGRIRALGQYTRNVEEARAALDAQENALNSMTDILTRARELSISQAGATATAQTRIAVKAEVDQLLRQAVGLANTRHNDRYLFGGLQADSAPATYIDGPVPSFTMADTTAAGEIQIGDGQRLLVVDDAETIFGNTSTGALASLRALSNALQNNDAAGIASAATDITTSFQTVQARLGATGARANQLDMTAANLSALDLTLQRFRSELRDVDVETAMTELVSKQTTYQAAMAAATRVLDLNLTNYLR